MNKVYKDPKIALSTTDFDKPPGFDDSIFDLTGEEWQPAADEVEPEVPEIQI